jgi:hypothetical protein
VSGRFEHEDGERNDDREDDEGDQQVDPQCDAADRPRQVAVDAPPDERLDQLMDAEQQRQRRQQDVTSTAPSMAVGVDADRGDQRPANNVSGRREAHNTPAAWGPWSRRLS